MSFFSRLRRLWRQSENSLLQQHKLGAHKQTADPACEMCIAEAVQTYLRTCDRILVAAGYGDECLTFNAHMWHRVRRMPKEGRLMLFNEHPVHAIADYLDIGVNEPEFTELMKKVTEITSER